MERIIKMSDFHVPFQDPEAIKPAFDFVGEMQPEQLVIDEVIDFYSISKFCKDPKRKLNLQKDLDSAAKILKRIRCILPNTRIIMVESNHDERLTKYLNSKAEELSQLRALKFESLMGLKALEIEYKVDYIHKHVLFKHGDMVKTRSGDTANAELSKEGVSGVTGHTHRLAMIYKTLRGGAFVWVEGGCLCKIKNIEYIDGTANWQQGISMFTFERYSNHFRAEVLPIIDKKISWGNMIFK